MLVAAPPRQLALTARSLRRRRSPRWRAPSHEFEPVTMCVKPGGLRGRTLRAVFEDDENVMVVEMTSDDAWVRDCGPTFVVNDDGDVRAVHWHFNAWGGLYDGLYFPWDKDALVAREDGRAERRRALPPRQRSCWRAAPSTWTARAPCITTEMCLLSAGPQPASSRRSEHRSDYAVRVPGRGKGHLDQGRHRPRRDERPHRRRGLLRPPRRGGLHLDRRRGQPVLRGGARRLRARCRRPPTRRAAS